MTQPFNTAYKSFGFNERRAIKAEIIESIRIKKRTGLSDERINTLSPDRILCEYSGWKLGDIYWWMDMKHYFDVLSEK